MQTRTKERGGDDAISPPDTTPTVIHPHTFVTTRQMHPVAHPVHPVHPVHPTPTHLHNGVFTIPDIRSPEALIGSGSYGKVYAGVQRLLLTERSVAIKLHEDPFLLNREVKVYRYLWTHLKTGYAPTLRIPRLLWDGHTDDQTQRALVMERLGDSLDKLFDRDNKRWSPKTVCWVAREAIGLLQGLHTLGILHRDIKPDNFAIGWAPECRASLYLFDFGLSAQYIDATRQHHPVRTGLSLIGTMRYASIRNHEGVLQSRRDDLESLCYVLMYFCCGTLPWKRAAKDIEDRQERNTAVVGLKRGLGERMVVGEWMDTVDGAGVGDGAVANGATDDPSLPEPLAAFYRYTHTLGYDDTPEYDRWIRVFEEAMGDLEGFVPDWVVGEVGGGVEASVAS